MDNINFYTDVTESSDDKTISEKKEGLIKNKFKETLENKDEDAASSFRPKASTFLLFLKYVSEFWLITRKCL